MRVTYRIKGEVPCLTPRQQCREALPARRGESGIPCGATGSITSRQSKTRMGLASRRRLLFTWQISRKPERMSIAGQVWAGISSAACPRCGAASWPSRTSAEQACEIAGPYASKGTAVLSLDGHIEFANVQSVSAGTASSDNNVVRVFGCGCLGAFRSSDLTDGKGDGSIGTAL
jgi:hypothetical protein